MPDYCSLLPKHKLFKNVNLEYLNIRVSRFMIDRCVLALREKGYTFISETTAYEATKSKKRMMKQFEGENVRIETYPSTYEDPETHTVYNGYSFWLYREPKSTK